MGTGILNGLLYQQEELTEICAERPLDWLEYAHMNEFHGNAEVIRRFAGLPPDEPLPFGVEHAIPYDLEQAYEYDVNNGLPLFLAANESSAALYRRDTLETHPVGFTFLYAMELFQARHPVWPEERRGTLVFPDKSTLLMDTDFDRAAFAERLCSLPEEYHPVVVCIYWKDFVRGAHRPFQEAGLPLVSCGHLRDGDFLFRLYDLCRRFRYSCANDIAGSFTLSVLSGCHFFHLPGGPLRQEKYGKVETHEQDPGLSKPDKAACLASAPFPPADPGPQIALAQRLAGAEYRVTAGRLRKLYEIACTKLSQYLPQEKLTLPCPDRQREIFAFRPVGVDTDGWCRPRTVLRIPAGEGTGKLRLKLVLPGPPDVEESPTTVQVMLDGQLQEEISVTASDFSVVLMFPLGSQPHTVELRTDKEFQLPGEIRKRSFHLRELTYSRKPPKAIAKPEPARRGFYRWRLPGRRK